MASACSSLESMKIGPVKKSSRRLEVKFRKTSVRLNKELIKEIKRKNFWRNKYYTLRKEKLALNRKNKILVKKVNKYKQSIKILTNNATKLKTRAEKHVFDTTLIKLNPNNNLSFNLCNKYYKKKIESTTNSNISSEYAKKWRFIKNEIIDFYLSDENSTQSPGIQDVITKKKVKKRKRYLNNSLVNLHKKYCFETKRKISRTFFKNLRPFWVIEAKLSTRETCLCRQHTNFKFIFNKLRYLKIINCSNTQSYIESICCDINKKACLFKECDICKSNELPNNNSSELTSYYSWELEKTERTGSKNLLYKVQVMNKKTITCTISELVSEFNSLLPKFLHHTYTTTHQLKFLSNPRKTLKKNEVHLIADFSQNYECKYNKEVHAVHFGASKKQVSLHAGGFYYRNDKNEIVFESFCSVSNCLRHDASAVWALLKPVLKRIQELLPDLEIIHFQSDGPTS